MKRVYKDIKGYEGLYKISNDGEVYSVRSSRLLAKTSDKNARTTHQYVKLQGKKHYVHRLVAEYFIPNPENKPYVNHIDGNPKNNLVSNLEWVTHLENMEHARETGLFKNTKYTNEQVGKIKTLQDYGVPDTVISDVLEVPFTLVNDVKRNRRRYIDQN
ncbi:NUMOD4 motif-containing HNH endonuclease [Bacillus licheniformis]|uniref:NUMOD4 motif-containing HNH endonuclease n=1 Tax=Bacillus licheniformis TaxID=1402 RepID=UPI0031F4A5BE